MTAFRDRHAACLYCEAGLARTETRLVCEHCASMLVGDGELQQILEEVDPDDLRPLVTRLVAAAAPARTCPACPTEMHAYVLADTVVDRCAAHGTWFDPGELQRVLHALATARTSRLAAGGSTMLAGGLTAFVAFEAVVAGATAALVGPIAAVAAAAFGIGAVRRYLARDRFARATRR
nr:zf-TFIIB domain-containing protein [Kofleriaceae bacterium]